MSYRLNRFQPPEDLTDQAIKLNNLYYKRLDMLEEIRKLENSLDEANQTEARKIREEIAVLQEEAWQLERRMDDMGCSP
ncbi:MAG: hypothetical protein HFI72_07355 [Peptococcaceae bacterium]|jgi:DNA-binding protein H-NS|nr:hypothetical protein [Peptococcaceae bacterium]